MTAGDQVLRSFESSRRYYKMKDYKDKCKPMINKNKLTKMNKYANPAHLQTGESQEKDKTRMKLLPGVSYKWGI